MPFPFSPKQTNIPAELQRVSMPPDGNCLFYAVAGALRGDAKSAREWMPRVLKNKTLFNRDMKFLREKVANFLSDEAITKRNTDYFYLMGETPDQVKDYIESVRTNKWADDLEITALMEIYHRPIYVIDASGHLRFTPNQASIGDGDPIFVYYHQYGNHKSKSAAPNHYDLLIVKKGCDAREIAKSLVQETETYNQHKAEADRAYRLLYPMQPLKPAPGETVPPPTPTTRVVPHLYYPGDFSDIINIDAATERDSRRSSPTTSSSNGTSENTSISSLEHVATQSPPKVAPRNPKDPTTAEFYDRGSSSDSSHSDDASSSPHKITTTKSSSKHRQGKAAIAKLDGIKSARVLEARFKTNLAAAETATDKLNAETRVLLGFQELAIIAATSTNFPNQQEYIEGLIGGIENLKLKLKVINQLLSFYTTHSFNHSSTNKPQNLRTIEDRIIIYLNDEKAKFNTTRKTFGNP